MSHRLVASCLVLGLLSLGTYLQQSIAFPNATSAVGDEYGCDTGIGPDVIVAEIFDTMRWGTIDDVTAYTFGASSLNIGDEELPWIADTANHPLIGSSVYRIDDDGFEILGVSWLKHGFGALQLGGFCDCTDSGDYDYLGVGCSDPYCADLNGDQAGFFGISGLGPRWQVDPFTGVFPFPYSTQGQSGDALYKRIQIDNDDLDSSLNPDARYVAEVHYVSLADATAGNGANNASWTEFTVGSMQSGGYNLVIEDPTHPRYPAIYAWAEFDSDVTVTEVQIPDEGTLHVAWRVTENDDGSWQYVYAVQNVDSARAVRGLEFTLDAGTTISNVSFHGVSYHSGEPYSDADWTSTVTDDAFIIGTETHDTDSDANAIRFGTAYTVSFDSNSGPAKREMTLALFVPGTPDFVTVAVEGPASGGTLPGDLNGDGVVNGEDLTIILAAWGSTDPQYDLDGDGVVGGGDLTIVLGDWTF